MAIDVPQRASPFRPDTLSTADPDILGQPNVGLFGWTTNDLTSVKDIITYVNTALQAAESAQANAKYVADSLDRMEELNTQYQNVLNQINSMYVEMQAINENVNTASNNVIAYADETKGYRDATKSYHDEVKILRDEVIAYAMQSIYKYGDAGNVPSGTLNINIAAGSVQNFVLTQAETNIDVMTFTDPTSTCRQLTLMFVQGTGANQLKWPTKVKWNNDRNPIFSYVQGKMDVITLLTKDSGVSWYGFYNGGWFNA